MGKNPRPAQSLQVVRATAPRSATRGGGWATLDEHVSGLARLALVAAASAAWLLVPSLLPGQSRDSAAVKERPRTGAAARAAPPCCLIVRLDGASAIVTARETATGYTFRFEVKDRRRRAALKVGDPVWADFGTRAVKLRSTDAAPCCPIVTTPPGGEFESSGSGGAPPATRIPDPRI